VTGGRRKLAKCLLAREAACGVSPDCHCQQHSYTHTHTYIHTHTHTHIHTHTQKERDKGELLSTLQRNLHKAMSRDLFQVAEGTFCKFSP